MTPFIAKTENCEIRSNGQVGPFRKTMKTWMNESVNKLMVNVKNKNNSYSVKVFQCMVMFMVLMDLGEKNMNDVLLMFQKDYETISHTHTHTHTLKKCTWLVWNWNPDRITFISSCQAVRN